MTPQDAALLASLTGYTPGPWRVRPDPEHGMPTLSLSSGGYDIATLWHGYLAADSDAALIAAAPDLHRIATEKAAENERLREALERAAFVLAVMPDIALRVGLAGTSKWDEIAGGPDLFGALDQANAALQVQP